MRLEINTGIEEYEIYSILKHEMVGVTPINEKAPILSAMELFMCVIKGR